MQMNHVVARGVRFKRRLNFSSNFSYRPKTTQRKAAAQDAWKLVAFIPCLSWRK